MSPSRNGNHADAILTACKACCKLLIILILANPIFTVSRAQNLAFPTEVERFIKMTEIQQKEHEKRVAGMQLSGSGKITNVEECGVLSQSKLYGRDCYEIVLDRGTPRAVLYVSKTERDRVINLSKGREFAFNNCIIRGLRNAGFWSTVYCDLPRNNQSAIGSITHVDKLVSSQQEPADKKIKHDIDVGNRCKGSNGIVLACKTDRQIIGVYDLRSSCFGSGNFSYKSWNNPKTMEEKPDVNLVQRDSVLVEGSGFCSARVASFSTGNIKYKLREIVCSDGSEPKGTIGEITVEIDGVERMRKWCRQLDAN